VNRLAPSERLLAGALAVLAGFVDAVGFVEMGGFFVSFMSGNSTRAAVGLAQHSSDAVRAGGLIASFVVGVMIGTLIRHARHRRRREAILLMVSIMLAVAAALGMARQGLVATLVMAASMGALNAVFGEGGEVKVGVTYMTGALVKLGQRLALSLVGQDRFGWAAFFIQWMCLMIGAVIGAAVHPVLGLNALWIPSVVALALSLVIWMRRDSDDAQAPT
jgi:uncharacterized membrane protein YoaK (UPF0700 family)